MRPAGAGARAGWWSLSGNYVRSCGSSVNCLYLSPTPSHTDTVIKRGFSPKLYYQIYLLGHLLASGARCIQWGVSGLFEYSGVIRKCFSLTKSLLYYAVCKEVDLQNVHCAS